MTMDTRQNNPYKLDMSKAVPATRDKFPGCVPYPSGYSAECPPAATETPRVIVSKARFGAEEYHRAGRLLSLLEDRALIAFPAGDTHEFCRHSGSWLAGPTLDLVDYVVYDRDFSEKISASLDIPPQPLQTTLVKRAA